MTVEEALAALRAPTRSPAQAFAILAEIARMLGRRPDDPDAQALLIRALEHREDFEACSALLNGLLRETGLYPYVDPSRLTTRDRLALEFHRPEGRFGKPNLVFHRVQAQVYWRLVDGENVILSAPTSFGKSLVVDALIASGRFKRVALVVPTIALIDETRQRLSAFAASHKVITHASQPADPKRGTVYVLTQERVIERTDLDDLDLFVIDEFYKLDPGGGDADRAAILNHAFYKLLRTARQFYLLGPNVRTVPIDFRERFAARLVVSDFATVATDVRRVAKPNGAREALVGLAKEIDGAALIYCRSPNSVRRVAQLLVEREVVDPVPELADFVDWIGRHYHPDWILTRALAHGVGIHHGRLPRALAQLLVRLFNEGHINFLVCTSTLIEGVNTAAKHVILYDNAIARKPIDYFTYRNIQGRSGRMFRHFVGTVHLFHAPPAADLLDVDFPAFSQTEAASDGLLVQLDEGDLGSEGLRRVRRFREQGDLSFATIRANTHVDPGTQIDLARRLRSDAKDLHPALSWRGEPTNDQVYAISDLLFDTLLATVGRTAVRSARQLAFLVTELRSRGAASFIQAQANSTDPRASDDPSVRVENALEFLRNWAGFHLPRALVALDRIQGEVFGRLGLHVGSYSSFAVRLENLFLPPALAALDEYGLPFQVASKLGGRLPASDSLDAVLSALRDLKVGGLNLTAFEERLIAQVRSTL